MLLSCKLFIDHSQGVEGALQVQAGVDGLPRPRLGHWRQLLRWRCSGLTLLAPTGEITCWAALPGAVYVQRLPWVSGAEPRSSAPFATSIVRRGAALAFGHVSLGSSHGLPRSPWPYLKWKQHRFLSIPNMFPDLAKLEVFSFHKQLYYSIYFLII